MFKNRKWVKFAIAFLAAALLLSFAACEMTKTPEKTTAEKLAEAKNALAVTGANAVTASVTLPATGLHGSTVTWASSNTNVLGNNGAVVFRPILGDAAVKLTATIKIGGETATKDFNATVKERAVIWKANMTDGVVGVYGDNDNVFTSGTLEDGKLTLKTTGHTRFGGYGTEWNGGFTIGTEIYLDPADFELDEYAIMSHGLNGKTNSSLAESHVVYYKNAEGLKAGAALEAAYSGTDLTNSVLIPEAGWYIVAVTYYADDGVVSAKTDIYKSGYASIFSFSHKPKSAASGYTDPVDVGDAGGNRAGWFVENNVAKGLQIKNLFKY